jgi:hypothetical protein
MINPRSCESQRDFWAAQLQYSVSGASTVTGSDSRDDGTFTTSAIGSCDGSRQQRGGAG